MVLGLLLGIVAQTCATMLPATSLEFEWFLDGRPYAHDILIRTRAGERLYQRRFENGEIAERLVSCTRTGRTVYFTELVGSYAPVRIPVELSPDAVRTVAGTTVRRVAPPPGSAANMSWYMVANPGVRLYGLRPWAGITEIRIPERGGYAVLRGIARNRGDRAASDSLFAALAQRVEQLEAENRRLRDSINSLRSRVRRRNAADGGRP